MRQTFAHDAVLTMDPDGDLRAPGGEVHLRILFAVEPEREGAVRQAIDGALAGGRQAGPDGAVTRWRLDTTASSAVSEDEADHAARLARS